MGEGRKREREREREEERERGRERKREIGLIKTSKDMQCTNLYMYIELHIHKTTTICRHLFSLLYLC